MISSKDLARRLCLALFPGKVERAIEKRTAKRTAMQAMLEISGKMRERGFDVEDIDSRLSAALGEYNRGRYERAADYARSPIFTGVVWS